ncbi:unnamed protein product [Polarella glacialis]|uniref:Alpha N-terminal protein methyltransferase 1 n=2 Tax=Polarella glacialis TaxID=89957 RepID=A0A813KF86_POLGL|nr:unnamed protein product [Polarella glacialis]
MIGDDSSADDIAHSCGFLAQALEVSHVYALGSVPARTALDCGAGLGRVARGVLLPVVSHVTLVEMSAKWLQIARSYVGVADRCTFVNARLEEYEPPAASFDVIWVQWTLQYLIDEDVVGLLSRLGAALTDQGVLVLKENRPLREGFEDQFQMDTPAREGRFDIVRPDAHFAVLIELACLVVRLVQPWDECSCWVLVRPEKDRDASAVSEESDDIGIDPAKSQKSPPT